MCPQSMQEQNIGDEGASVRTDRVQREGLDRADSGLELQDLLHS